VPRVFSRRVMPRTAAATVRGRGWREEKESRGHPGLALGHLCVELGEVISRLRCRRAQAPGRASPSAPDRERVGVNWVGRPVAEFARIFITVRAADPVLENQAATASICSLVTIEVSRCDPNGTA